MKEKPKKAGPRCPYCGEKLRDTARPLRIGPLRIPGKPSGHLICPNHCPQPKEAEEDANARR